MDKWLDQQRTNTTTMHCVLPGSYVVIYEYENGEISCVA
jgi:hypothetical protein